MKTLFIYLLLPGFIFLKNTGQPMQQLQAFACSSQAGDNGCDHKTGNITHRNHDISITDYLLEDDNDDENEIIPPGKKETTTDLQSVTNISVYSATCSNRRVTTRQLFLKDFTLLPPPIHIFQRVIKV